MNLGNILKNTTKEMDLNRYQSKATRTDTTRFLLPQMFSRKEIMGEHFVNAYIWNDLYPEERYIAIMYTQPIELPIIPDITITEKDITVYFIKIPDHLIGFVDKFMQGKYSKFSSQEKSKILIFWGQDKNSRLHNILYPTDYFYEIGDQPALLYRKGEIWPKPDTLKETFIYNKS